MSSQVYQDFMNCRVSHDLAGSLNTLPVPISRKDCPFKTRYVFAYGVDNSDRPSYLLWPIRGGNGQFLLVDPWSGNYFDLEAAKFMEPIGIEHFFDAFSLDKKLFFFCCIAELAIKPCRSSRSKLRGEFGIPKHLQNGKQKTQQSNKHPKPKTQHKTKRTRQVFGM